MCHQKYILNKGPSNLENFQGWWEMDSVIIVWILWEWCNPGVTMTTWWYCITPGKVGRVEPVESRLRVITSGSTLAGWNSRVFQSCVISRVVQVIAIRLLFIHFVDLHIIHAWLNYQNQGDPVQISAALHKF